MPTRTEYQFAEIIDYANCPYRYKLRYVEQVAEDSLVELTVVRFIAAELTRRMTTEGGKRFEGFAYAMRQVNSLHKYSGDMWRARAETVTSELLEWARNGPMLRVEPCSRKIEVYGADIILKTALVAKDGRYVLFDTAIRKRYQAWFKTSLFMTLPAENPGIICVSVSPRMAQTETDESKGVAWRIGHAKRMAESIIDAIRKDAFPKTDPANASCDPRACGYSRLCYLRRKS